MRSHRSVLLASILMAASVAASADERDIVINEIFYQHPDTDDWFELKNTGFETIDVSTWFFCCDPMGVSICVGVGAVVILTGDDLILEPGEIVTLDMALFASEVAGEFALFSNSDTMVDFLNYGSGIDFGRAQEAVDAGLWTRPPGSLYDFIPVSGPTESASWCGTNSGGGHITLSSDFQNGPPTMGVDNPCASEMFFDGFESGDTSAWSGAVGGT